MTERRRLTVRGPHGLIQADVTAATEPPWSLRIELPGGRTFTAEDKTLFAALRALRRQLESEGLLLCCQGCMPNVWPSGMSSQMAGGRHAYRLHPGRRSTPEDLVDILDPADCAEVVTVDEQRASVERLYDS
jgi:hypothetical protein